MSEDARPAERSEVQHFEHEVRPRQVPKDDRPSIKRQDQAVGYREYREALEVNVTEKEVRFY